MEGGEWRRVSGPFDVACGRTMSIAARNTSCTEKSLHSSSSFPASIFETSSTCRTRERERVRTQGMSDTGKARVLVGAGFEEPPCVQYIVDEVEQMLAGHVGVLHVLLDDLRQVVAHREL